MKHSYFRSLIFLLLAANFFLLLSQAHAIPAFARRNKISCMTCHAPFPRLKPYGEEFAANAMILKESEKERDYITAGDDMLWLNKEFPLAVRFDAFAVNESKNPVARDIQSPWGIKLLSGGALYKNIGYYFYFYMAEAGEVAGIEDAYIHFDNVLGTNLDVMVGQFQTSDPLMKRELRLTYEDYQIYKATVVASRINLTYDRGVMLLYSIDKTSTDLVGMVVNGNGKVEAGFDEKFDRDDFKNVGLRLSQSIGELLSVGGFYYTGKEYINSGTPENKVTYLGPDVSFSYGSIEITAQYLERKDENSVLSHPLEYKTKGIVCEMVISPRLDRSRICLTALYNKIDSDAPNLDYHTATLSGTYLLARNMRLVGEYRRDLEEKANRFVIGMVTGF